MGDRRLIMVIDDDENARTLDVWRFRAEQMMNPDLVSSQEHGARDNSHRVSSSLSARGSLSRVVTPLHAAAARLLRGRLRRQRASAR